MLRSTVVLVALLVPAVVTAAPNPAAPDSAVLRGMLDRFLAGASVNDSTTHDRFWADDLIYTGSGGRRIGKAQLMADVRSTPAPKPGDPTTRYGAEDVRVQQYGSAAIVAFRLVATTTWPESASVARYLNTGFFVRRSGRWQAAGWQATRLP